jgi:hypothetical protein
MTLMPFEIEVRMIVHRQILEGLDRSLAGDLAIAPDPELSCLHIELDTASRFPWTLKNEGAAKAPDNPGP